MQPIHLAGIDYAILIAYVAFVIGIGWTARALHENVGGLSHVRRSIPTWVTGLAFISANLGALELVGMAASGAKYGIQHRALLLGRRDSGDDLSRRVHDAVLLRLQGALGSRISENALRRACPRAKLDRVCGDDHFLPPAFR